MSIDMVMGPGGSGEAGGTGAAGVEIFVVISTNCTACGPDCNMPIAAIFTAGASAVAPSPTLSLAPMPACCEVALPVPLDRTFTYAVREDQTAAAGSAGGRALPQ